MNDIISVYEKEYEILKDLPQSVKSSIKELIFSYRNGIETICAVFNRKSAVIELLGPELPEKILLSDEDTYGIDLESISTDNVRIYHNYKKNDIIGGYGYSLKNSEIVEYKIYKRTSDRSVISIDRYNSNDELISENEKEIRAERSDWKGSKKIFELADSNGFYTNLLKKATKDQCYIRVRLI
jgi:hypothetical protein